MPALDASFLIDWEAKLSSLNPADKKINRGHQHPRAGTQCLCNTYIDKTGVPVCPELTSHSNRAVPPRGTDSQLLYSLYSIASLKQRLIRQVPACAGPVWTQIRRVAMRKVERDWSVTQRACRSCHTLLL